MKLNPGFQAKFLQYLNKRKQTDEGFTLIELLVVIIIIGILAAIALPSLLSQANKAKQAEARNNCGAIVRGEQAYLLEKGSFTSVLANLGLGLKTQTENYTYVMKGAGGTPANDEHDAIASNCTPNKRSLKAYVGIVGVGLVGQAGQAQEAAALGFVCESKGVSNDNNDDGDPGAIITPPDVDTDTFPKQACDASTAGTTAINAPTGFDGAWVPLGS